MRYQNSIKQKRIIRAVKCVIACLLVLVFMSACTCDLPDFVKSFGESESSTISQNNESQPVSEAKSENLEQPSEKSADAGEKNNLPEGSSFEVHYIDVGQGEAQLILCDREAMLIDGGSSSKSDLLYTYLKNLSINHLKYIVATHPDDDHVGGLAGALNYADTENAWSSVLTYDGNKAFGNFLKYLGNAELEVPNVGHTFSLGSASGIVLGPQQPLAENSNNWSLIIKMTYGDTTFLFTGDAEEEEEFEVLASGADLSATVLKIGHHGSSNSSSQQFLNAVNPEYAVISCGTKNQYKHPTDQTLSRLQNMGVKLYRTDLQGDIICRSDGKSVVFETEKNANTNTYMTYGELNSEETTTEPAVTNPSDQSASKVQNFIVNINPDSQKIHKATCRSVKQMKETNKQPETGTYQEILAKYPGFTPCQICHPDW